MRARRSPSRPFAALLAGALLVVACGDDDEASADTFCSGAMDFIQDSPALDDPTSEAAAEARERAADLEPPEAIAADWRTLLDGAEVLGDLGGSPEGDLPPEVEAMPAASTNVFRYLSEECGAALGLD